MFTVAFLQQSSHNQQHPEEQLANSELERQGIPVSFYTMKMKSPKGMPDFGMQRQYTSTKRRLEVCVVQAKDTAHFGRTPLKIVISDQFSVISKDRC